MSQLAVIAKLTAAPGKRDELVAVLQELVTGVADEDGTLIYALHTSNGDDTSVYFYELYTDQAANDVHSKSPTMAAVGPKLAGLLGGMPELTMLTPVGSKGLPS